MFVKDVSLLHSLTLRSRAESLLAIDEMIGHVLDQVEMEVEVEMVVEIEVVVEM